MATWGSPNIVKPIQSNWIVGTVIVKLTLNYMLAENKHFYSNMSSSVGLRKTKLYGLASVEFLLLPLTNDYRWSLPTLFLHLGFVCELISKGN